MSSTPSTEPSADRWRFHCYYHGVTFDCDDYQQHCTEEHGGLQIAVRFIPPGTEGP